MAQVSLDQPAEPLIVIHNEYRATCTHNNAPCSPLSGPQTAPMTTGKGNDRQAANAAVIPRLAVHMDDDLIQRKLPLSRR